MKYSKIGGQAVMEGIMMKNGNQYAVAVRKPDSDIEVEIFQYEGIVKNEKIRNFPLLRGVFSFIESLVIGMGALTFSASFFEEEEQDKGKEKDGEKEKKEGRFCHDPYRSLFRSSGGGDFYSPSLRHFPGFPKIYFFPYYNFPFGRNSAAFDFCGLCGGNLPDAGY